MRATAILAGWLLSVAAVSFAEAQVTPHLHPAPPEPISGEKLEAAMRRGVAFLVTTQNEDGSWGSSRWNGGVDRDPVPGSHHSFKTATTALCLEALLDSEDSENVRSARLRAESYLLRELPNLRRADPGNLPNVWGHCYGIQVLAELHRRSQPGDTARRKQLEETIRGQMLALRRFETVNGGWFYYADGITQKPLAPSCSFVNAAVLLALHRAKTVGIEAEGPTLERALRMTRLQRKPDSSFLYSISSELDRGNAMTPINRPSGSLGRSQAGNLCLRRFGDKQITDTVLREWLDRLITRNGWLDMGRKRPIPHESHAQVAGYFFYFGHYYGALCIAELPPRDRPFYQDHVAGLLLPLQEQDGSWFDYPLYSYHKPYGTAFALLSLQQCRKAVAP